MNPHLLTGQELSKDDINHIINLSYEVKLNPIKYNKALADKSLAMIFDKPSFRTRISFARAIQSLGGSYVESISSNRKHEELTDTIRVLNGYCDFIMLRMSVIDEISHYAEIPVINGLSNLYHPCQVLSDIFTLKEHFGFLEGVNLTYIGDGNNILHSLMMLLPIMGVRVTYCCPAQHQPNERIMKHFNHNLITKSSSVEEAVSGADAVYTDVWTSMGFSEKQQEDFQGFQVNENLMSLAKPAAVFMHCMPMNRGQEVSNTLPDSKTSIIFKQSANRLHVQKGILLFLDNF